MLINRSRQMGLGRSHNSDLSGSAGLTFKVPVLFLTSNINLSGSYSDGRSRDISQQKTDYYRESTPGPFRNYYSTTPSNAYSYSASWDNSFRVPRNFSIVPSYSYSQSYNSARCDLFSFDRLGDETLLPFGFWFAALDHRLYGDGSQCQRFIQLYADHKQSPRGGRIKFIHIYKES